MLKAVNKFVGAPGLPSTQTWDMAAVSTDILPSGCPIMSSIFVVDKMDVVICDGEGNWYHEADKPVAAGQPISELFA